MQSVPKIEKIAPDEMAIAILGWLATEPELLSRFLALTGIGPSDLRHQIGDSGFQAGLLDFIMQHEPSLIAFCNASGYKPEQVAATWSRVSGPGLDSGEY